MPQRNNITPSVLSDYRNKNNIDRAEKKIDQLEERLAICELTNSALVTILKRNGVTTEEIHDELLKAVSKIKPQYESNSNPTCPKCTRFMQKANANPFAYRCIYCNTTINKFPFDNEDEESN